MTTQLVYGGLEPRRKIQGPGSAFLMQKMMNPTVVGFPGPAARNLQKEQRSMRSAANGLKPKKIFLEAGKKARLQRGNQHDCRVELRVTTA